MRQPEPELSNADANSLRQALSPVTLSEPDVESPTQVTNVPDTPPSDRAHLRPTPNGEPPTSRPRLAEEGQASIDPNQLDDHPARRLLAESESEMSRVSTSRPGPSPSSAIRWESREAGRWTPQPGANASPNSCLATDDATWQGSVEDAVWYNSGKPIWLSPTEALELFNESENNITGFVAFELDEMTGLTAAVVKRVSEIFPNQIKASDWPRFHAATVKEWKAILGTPAVTIITPDACLLYTSPSPRDS